MTWFRRLGEWFRGRSRDEALREELEAHRAFTQDELERSGLSPADAGAESRRRMGNLALAREDVRDVWIVRWADQLRQHLRFGGRGLRREPAFALTAILTLALGAAATTTVFSVVDAELWRPLPFSNPRQLFAVYTRASEQGASVDGISLTELADWRSRLTAFSSLAANGSRTRRTLQRDHAESILTNEVTANYFSTLGRTAILGRVFTDIDARGSDAAILTERGWRRAFDADPSVIGRVVTLDGLATAIVGVVADDDALGPEPELFLPIDESPLPAHASATRLLFGATGRLAAGSTKETARLQLQATLEPQGSTVPKWLGHQAVVEDLAEFYANYNWRPLYFFLGASILVLVLTVTNIAGLLVARALRRAPEFALRGALGGGTRAIAMQLAVEAGLIAIPGCALGLLLAYQAVGLTSLVVPDDFLVRGTRIVVDVRAAAFSLAVAIVTIGGLAFVPLGLARRAGASAALGSGNRTSGSASAGHARAILLTAQLALTVVLLAGAGLFLKSFAGLMHVPLGFDPADASSLRVTLSGPRYMSGDEWRAYADQLSEQARAIPGVRGAAIATTSPLLSGPVVMATETGRRAPAPGDAGRSAGTRSIYRAVSGDYFATLGTGIVRGRGLLSSDVLGSPDVAVINEVFARRMFPNEDPVGRHIDLEALHGVGIRSGTVTIVGVAANIKEISLNEVEFPDLYVPFAQRPAADLELIVRGGQDEKAMAAALRTAAARVDPSIPVASVSSLARRVTESMRGARFNLILVAGFAVIAVVIAAIGIYGAMAYAATARRREFGVRLALGATPRGLVGTALWSAGRIGLIGGACGLGGALLFAMVIGDALYLVQGLHSGLLFNVKTTDPAALAAALGGVLLVTLIAGAIPARKAGRVNPVTALRAD